MDWHLGYNTSGFAHHRIEDAIGILADLGYEAVAITPDVHHLDPLAAGTPAALPRIRALLERHGLRSVIETGARFLLDPRRKHFPSLLSSPAVAATRLRFLERCIDMAAELGAGVVSFWSGADFENVGAEAAMDRLARGVEAVLAHARRRGVRAALEPEPGMFVDRLAQVSVLRERIGAPDLGLVLDVGHLVVTGEMSVPEAIGRFDRRIATVHLEDMRRGIHEHLPFGEGDIDMPAVIAALDSSGFSGVASVELSRSSADAVETARRSLEVLRRLRRRSGSGA